MIQTVAGQVKREAAGSNDTVAQHASGYREQDDVVYDCC